MASTSVRIDRDNSEANIVGVSQASPFSFDLRLGVSDRWRIKGNVSAINLDCPITYEEIMGDGTTFADALPDDVNSDIFAALPSLTTAGDFTSRVYDNFVPPTGSDALGDGRKVQYLRITFTPGTSITLASLWLDLVDYSSR